MCIEQSIVPVLVCCKILLLLLLLDISALYLSLKYWLQAQDSSNNHQYLNPGLVFSIDKIELNLCLHGPSGVNLHSLKDTQVTFMMNFIFNK